MATINGTAGADWIHKVGDGHNPPDTTWNHISTVTDAADTINAGAEDDFVFAAGGNDTVNGGADLDWLYGEAGNDRLNGQADNDELYGDIGNDTLNGGDGHDDLYGGADDDSLDGGAGRDLIDGGTGNDTIRCDGDDIVEAGDGDDTVLLGAFIPLPGGVCTLGGGAGTDTLRFTSGFTPPGGVQTAYFLFTQFGSFERFEFATSANTIALFADFQFGGGLKADATIKGSANGDYLIFTASQPQGLSDYSTANFTFVNWSWATDALILGTNSTDTGAHQILGTKFGETIIGAMGADTLKGNRGNDTLRGGDGNDTLDGGDQADRLEGGDGNDTYLNVDIAAGDTIVETATGGTADIVQTNRTVSLAAIPFVERILLTGSGAINATGNDLANIITGNEGANRLEGGLGNDTLNGAAGLDTLVGGAGNDTYNNPGPDEIIEAAGSAGGNDIVQSNTTITLAANVERLTLTGAANINGTGNASANVITGNTGANVLDGGAQNDTLNGGAGKDVLIGGAGNDTMNGGTEADTFRFAVSGTGADRIEGYSTAQDRFDLTGGTFSKRVEDGGNTTLTHAGGTILIVGVTGLTLAQWNARVLPPGGVAGANEAATEAPYEAAFAPSDFLTHFHFVPSEFHWL